MDEIMVVSAGVELDEVAASMACCQGRPSAVGAPAE